MTNSVVNVSPEDRQETQEKTTPYPVLINGSLVQNKQQTEVVQCGCFKKQMHEIHPPPSLIKSQAKQNQIEIHDRENSLYGSKEEKFEIQLRIANKKGLENSIEENAKII